MPCDGVGVSFMRRSGKDDLAASRMFGFDQGQHFRTVGQGSRIELYALRNLPLEVRLATDQPDEQKRQVPFTIWFCFTKYPIRSIKSLLQAGQYVFSPSLLMFPM
jgi:hypothetical protein